MAKKSNKLKAPSTTTKRKKLVAEIMLCVLAGFTYEEACDNHDVAYEDFLDWVTNTKTYKDIKDKYEAEKLLLVEQSVFRLAVGFEVQESVKTEKARRDPKSGDLTFQEATNQTKTRQVLPSVQAQMLFLVNRDPERWNADQNDSGTLEAAMEQLRQDMLDSAPIMEPEPVEEIVPEVAELEIPVDNQNEKKMIER